MRSKLFFSLNSIKNQKNYFAGNLTTVTSEEVSGLMNIAFASLKLNPKGVLEPIWHPNANKIAYCLEGKALVSIRTPKELVRFTVKAGDVFFIPQGYIHHIENIGPETVQIKFAFNASLPQTMHLSQAMQSLTNGVCTATFGTPTGFIDGLKENKVTDWIATLPPAYTPPEAPTSRYEFNIAASNKPIQTKGGYLQLATKSQLSVLEGLGILGFGLNPGGVVEPHWHTNAGELVYIVKGTTRITVLSPDGHVEVLEVKGGEGAFAPASHFHNIENIGNDPVEVIAFFNHAEPDYIGIAEVIGSFDNELLASIFNVSPTYFETLKKTSDPLVIVPV